jgi:hypothetical protein
VLISFQSLLYWTVDRKNLWIMPKRKTKRVSILVVLDGG